MLTLVRLWILASALLVSAGWILSALHQLNRAGYAIIFTLAGIAVFFWQQTTQWRPRKEPSQFFYKLVRRCKRPAPGLFLLLTLLALLSGLLYPALNYDANAYRLPRVFHWLHSEQWHWIHTFDPRMNIAGCGFEWMSAPLMLFTHTDRFLFLINWMSFLMLPGLMFSVFIRLQVRPRTAWWWAWFLAAGWCFALQAGSIANDSFAAVYILAAVDLALRARESKSVTDLWLSLLAAALATGVKQTNLPLAVLWLIAAWPGMRWLWVRPVGSAVVAALGLLVSIVPTSVLNYEHSGSWLPLHGFGMNALGSFQLNPFWGIVGNAFCIPVQNLLPPFYELLPPFYAYSVLFWNETMRRFLDTPFGAHFSSFENFGFLSGTYYHGVSEGNAGLGLGICLLFFAALLEMHRQPKRTLSVNHIQPDKFLRLLRLSPWVLLVVFMAKVGNFESARLLAPYYAFLFPAFLISPKQVHLMRNRQWQKFGLLIMAFTAVLTATLAERPLFPVKTTFPHLREKFPSSDPVASLCTRYLESNYQAMEACRNYLRTILPPDEATVGYYGEIWSVNEPGIWLPRPQRRVDDITSGDTSDWLRSLGIHYVVVEGSAARRQDGGINNWMKKYDARIAGEYTFPRPSLKSPPSPDLYLLQLN